MPLSVINWLTGTSWRAAIWERVSPGFTVTVPGLAGLPADADLAAVEEGKDQFPAHFHMVGIADAVELQESAEGNVVTFGDLREGFTGFDHHFSGQARQRQHQGQ